MVFLILLQPTSGYLTENGKRWLAKHAGIDGCFADSGVTLIDPVKGVSAKRSTAHVLAAMFVLQSLGGMYKFLSILENGPCYYDFYKANGYNLITTEDIAWVQAHQSGANRYCILNNSAFEKTTDRVEKSPDLILYL